jgi:sugar-specific transcriptional regulator TrmB
MASHYSTLQVRQAFKRLGFSDNEVKVLIFLFYTKKSTAKEISQETAIAFSSTQYCLSNLSVRNLVKVVPAREDFFEIISERELFDWIDKAKEKNEQVYERSKEEIHNFLAIIQNKSWKPQVQYFEGREGIIEIYEDMLETANRSDKNIYSLLDMKKIYEIFPDYVEKYIKKRVKMGIISNDILPNETVIIKKSHKEEKRNVKFAKGLSLNGQIRIYGNKVCLITFHKEKPVGFVFEGETMTALIKPLFKKYWDSL